MEGSGLATALECAARGWPVVPGALWTGDTYVDPVTGFDGDALVLCSPGKATVDVEQVRRLWPVLDGGVTRSALMVLGPTVAAFAVKPERARHVIDSEAFRAAPTPVVVLPLPVIGLMAEHAVFVLSSEEGLDDIWTLPPGGVLPLPPVVVEGHEARWLVPPGECGELMAGPVLAGLLETSDRR